MSVQVAAEQQQEQHHQLDGASTIGSIKLNLNANTALATTSTTSLTSTTPITTTSTVAESAAAEKPQLELGGSQNCKRPDAGAPPEEASESSETSRSSWNSSKRTDHHLQHQRLSVVLPPSQKSLLTPTIITTGDEQPALVSTPSQLFSSLVQLNGQEVGLFTGLPSCTPNSADCLTTSNLSGINPFFWGVQAFNSVSDNGNGEKANGAPAPDGNATVAGQQQAEKAVTVAGRGAAGSESVQASVIEADKAERRQQLSKLSLDHFQTANAMIYPLSPLSFLLSPEQESWLRFGLQQANQHPLAAAVANAQASGGASSDLPLNQASTYGGRSATEHDVMAYQQQDHFRLAAQDLSNKMAAAHQQQQQQQQASAQNGASANIASTFNSSSAPPTDGVGASSYLPHRAKTTAVTHYGRAQQQQQQSIIGNANNANYSNVLAAATTINNRQQISSSTVPAASRSFQPPSSNGMQHTDQSQPTAHLIYQQQPQQAPGAATSQPTIICTQSSPTSMKLAPKLPENGAHKADQSPLSAHRQQQQSTLILMSNGAQVDSRLVEFHHHQQQQHQQQNPNASRQGQAATALHYENGQPIDIYADQHLRQLCLAQHHHNQHNYHLQQQQQLHQQQNHLQHQQQHHSYQELRTRHQQPSYQHQVQNGQQQAQFQSQSTSPYGRTITNVHQTTTVTKQNSSTNTNYHQPHNSTKEPISNSSSLSSFNVSPRQSLSGNNSSSARSSVSRDTISVDVTVTANSRPNERGLESSTSSSSLSPQEQTIQQQCQTTATTTKHPIGKLQQDQASNTKKRAKTGNNDKQVTQELPENEVVRKKSKGGRKKKLVTHEELIARKNRSKERNRVAAKRCRQKRKQFLDELRGRIDNLNDSNRKLQKENTMLKNELELLKEHHKTCMF